MRYPENLVKTQSMGQVSNGDLVTQDVGVVRGWGGVGVGLDDRK